MDWLNDLTIGLGEVTYCFKLCLVAQDFPDFLSHISASDQAFVHRDVSLTSASI